MDRQHVWRELERDFIVINSLEIRRRGSRNVLWPIGRGRAQHRDLPIRGRSGSSHQVLHQARPCAGCDAQLIERRIGPQGRPLPAGSRVRCASAAIGPPTRAVPVRGTTPCQSTLGVLRRALRDAGRQPDHRARAATHRRLRCRAAATSDTGTSSRSTGCCRVGSKMWRSSRLLTVPICPTNCGNSWPLPKLCQHRLILAPVPSPRPAFSVPRTLQRQRREPHVSAAMTPSFLLRVKQPLSLRPPRASKRRKAPQMDSLALRPSLCIVRLSLRSCTSSCAIWACLPELLHHLFTTTEGDLPAALSPLRLLALHESAGRHVPDLVRRYFKHSWTRVKLHLSALFDEFDAHFSGCNLRWRW